MKATSVFVVLVLSAALVFAFACGKSQPPAPASGSGAPAVSAAAPAAPVAAAPSEAAVKEAEGIFATRCTPCHGAGGKGDGAASKGLTPPPRNFTLADWQKSVTDEHIEKIIMYGGAAVGKSPAMPPNPDLTAKKEVIAALRAHIRKLGQ